MISKEDLMFLASNPHNKESLTSALSVELLAALARIAELEAELVNANHWRERHSRDSEAYVRRNQELRAALVKARMDAQCVVCVDSATA